MRLLSTLLIYLGYVLVYAGAADQGKFAQKPLLGITQDAYLSPGGADDSGSQGGQQSKSGINKPLTGKALKQSEKLGSGKTGHGGIAMAPNTSGPSQVWSWIRGAIGGL